MSMNRVQFQPGLSMPDFFRLYGTNERCEQALVHSRWPNGFVCPRPACDGASRTQFRRGGQLYFQCSRCQYQCSVIAGTIFASTKLGLSTWFLAMHLISKAKTNVSGLQLSRDLGVSHRTAWLLKHKLMEVMRLREEDRRLCWRVEIDDSYLGGERSGGTPGRGSENKVPFVAAVQTAPGGLPHLVCLSQRPFTNESMQEFAAEHLSLPLMVVSDGLQCFSQLAGPEQGSIHQRHITGGGKAAAQRPEFAAVNTVLGNLKTAMTGVYHAIDFAKYAHRYLAEFQYRFNRRYNLRSILGRLLNAAIQTCPHRRALIQLAEVGA